MNRTVLLFALTAALVASAAGPRSARADAPPSERASELFRRATKLYSASDLRAAEPLYEEAWRLRRSYDIASNYGALELDLDRPRRAAELLRFALDHAPSRDGWNERAAIEARLSRARQLVGAIVVRVSVEGAEVSVDGAPAGKAPLDAEVFVDPGEHVVAATLAGYGEARITVRVDKGAEEHPTLVLQPIPAPRRSLAPAVAGGAISVIALGVGATLVGMAEAKRGDANALHGSIQAAGGTCAAPSSPCTSLHGATAAADTFGNAGVALLAVGGGLAAATVTYVLWPGARPRLEKAPDVRVSFSASPAGGGAAITGSF
jgi:tetratricopeptide (TPR) repeat protein